jgi:hypothetical protein
MGRADRDVGAVVLGELGEARVEAIGPRDHRGGHAVDSPAARGTAQSLQDRMDRGGEVPDRRLLAEDGAKAPRVRQRADQDVCLLAPWSLLQLQPVPLDLLAGRVVDLHRRRLVAAVLAGGADRTKIKAADLLDQRGVAALEALRGQLAVQHAQQQVGIVFEAGSDVGAEGIEATDPLLLLLGAAISGEVAPDRLPVAACVAGDGRD